MRLARRRSGSTRSCPPTCHRRSSTRSSIVGERPHAPRTLRRPAEIDALAFRLQLDQMVAVLPPQRDARPGAAVAAGEEEEQLLHHLEQQDPLPLLLDLVAVAALHRDLHAVDDPHVLRELTQSQQQPIPLLEQDPVRDLDVLGP